jgi:hypothetical protein
VAASVRDIGDPAIGLAIGFGVAVAVALVGVAIGGRLHDLTARERVGSVVVAPGS